MEELGRARDVHRGIALRLAGIDELMAVGAQNDGSRRDLVDTGHGAGVVALAGDGDGDGTGDVGEVIGAVSHVVVGTLNERVALDVFDLRSPLVLVGVIGDVVR